MSSPVVRVVGLCGSLRPGSHTHMALKIALAGSAKAGAETRLIDLRDYDLGFCDGKEDFAQDPPDAIRLREEVRQAQGILLGTPEYHGSFSGVLKNALDLMSFKELEGKMVGLIGVSGGMSAAFNALTGLRMIGRALHAWVVPEQCGIGQAWKHFSADGTLDDERLVERLERVGHQTAQFAALHASEHFREFLEQWQGAPSNPGGGGDLG